LRDAWEIYDLRILLEPRAVASSVAAGDAGWRAELADAYELVSTRYADEDAMQPGAVEAHRDFHRIVRSRCDSAWLLRIADTLADQSTRMQFASLRARGGHRAARAEHAELYAAACAGDARRAADLTGAHLQRTLVALRFEGTS
jgi:DNA-binding GntR family transcriptional regulator